MSYNRFETVHTIKSNLCDTVGQQLEALMNLKVITPEDCVVALRMVSIELTLKSLRLTNSINGKSIDAQKLVERMNRHILEIYNKKTK